MFDSGQRLSLNPCWDAWLCHFLANGVRAGKGGMKGGDKRSSKLVRALCCKQDDLAQLVFFASNHAKYNCLHPYTCCAYKNAHPHKHIREGGVQAVCLSNKYTMSGTKLKGSCRFSVSEVTFTITTVRESTCVSVCAFVCVCYTVMSDSWEQTDSFVTW